MKHIKKSCVVYILTKLELGGAQKVCLALVDGMQASGRNTYLITGTQGVLVTDTGVKDNVVMLPSLRPELSLSSIVHDIVCCKALIQQIYCYKKKYPHLIIHTHSSKAGVLGRLVARIVNVPVVHTIHGYAFHDQQKAISWWIIYGIELLVSFCTTHYVCVSRADAKTGIRLFPQFKNKHTIIRAAVEHEKFNRSRAQAPSFPETSQLFIFGTISCFKPQKNLTHLIRAFSYVHSIMPHARLEIIGDGTMRQELEQLIASLGLTACVKLHGWQRDVVTLMKHWHTFVLSSLWEGLPCVVVEARLLHIPVVCYDTGGINEIIIHKKNGLLVERNNWKMLGDYMLEVISSQDLYLELQAYQDNLADFYYDTMLAEHDRLYAAVAQKKYMHSI